MASRNTEQALIPASATLEITTSGSAQTLTAPTFPANVLIMQNTATTDTATATDIRYTIGSTTPTASAGFLLEDGDPEVRWDFPSDNVPTVRVFLAASAELTYQWFISA